MEVRELVEEMLLHTVIDHLPLLAHAVCTIQYVEKKRKREEQKYMKSLEMLCSSDSSEPSQSKGAS